MRTHFGLNDTIKSMLQLWLFVFKDQSFFFVQCDVFAISIRCFIACVYNVYALLTFMHILACVLFLHLCLHSRKYRSEFVFYVCLSACVCILFIGQNKSIRIILLQCNFMEQVITFAYCKIDGTRREFIYCHRAKQMVDHHDDVPFKSYTRICTFIWNDWNVASCSQTK